MGAHSTRHITRETAESMLTDNIDKVVEDKRFEGRDIADAIQRFRRAQKAFLVELKMLSDKDLEDILDIVLYDTLYNFLIVENPDDLDKWQV